MNQNKILLLSKEELIDPFSVYNEFYSMYDMNQIRALIRIIFSAYIIRLDEQEAAEKEKVSIYQDQILKVLEASWLINKWKSI